MDPSIERLLAAVEDLRKRITNPRVASQVADYGAYTAHLAYRYQRAGGSLTDPHASKL